MVVTYEKQLVVSISDCKESFIGEYGVAVISIQLLSTLVSYEESVEIDA